MAEEKFEFQTETKKLMEMMIHSIYSNKEIFLRELISNASDALDKIRFKAVSDEALAEFTTDLHIRIAVDKEKRIIDIIDNGIGMTKDELVKYIGTIAKSGTKEFVELDQMFNKDSNVSTDMIGQFGVGFYSSFMVADKIKVISKSIHEIGGEGGDNTAWIWESDGNGYTIEPFFQEKPGTLVRLYLKPVDEEDGIQDFTQEHVIRQIVKKYSDFVSYPIKMEIKRTEYDRDEEGKIKEGDQGHEVTEDQVLNSMQAIWVRPENEVTEEEYKEFYKHIAHDWNDPLHRIVYRAEGRSEYKALLFVPSKPPYNMFSQDHESHGVNLYLKRIFIMQDCKELIPEYLRFMRGVVDSEDLSLNISREILQQNRQIQNIKSGLTNKILSAFASLLRDNRETYIKFWNELGKVLKEGLFQDQKNQEKILDVSLFYSTFSDGVLITLEDYISRMKEGQDKIYFITGDKRESLEKSPHLESFKAKGYEVLLLSDSIDEVWLQSPVSFKGKQFQSAAKGDVQLGTEEERKAEDESRKEKEQQYSELIAEMKKILEDEVKEVRLSSRLTDSPSCLVGDARDLSPKMEQLMRASGHDVPKVKRNFELNPDHQVIAKLFDVYQSDKTDSRIPEYTWLLYGQAVLSEGGQMPDVSAFIRDMNNVMIKSFN